MLEHRLLLVVILVIGSVCGEYVWTGTEWKWEEPGNTQQKLPDSLNTGSSSSSSFDTEVSEGSGAGNNRDDEYDEEDYDDDYTYDDDYEEPWKESKNKKKDKEKTSWGESEWGTKKSNKQKNKNKFKNTDILPATDDEDLIEGSGSDDFYKPVSPVNNWNNPAPDNNWNSNNNNNNNWNNNNNNGQNVYDVDDEYDEDYYDDYDDEDDIGFPGPEVVNNNNWGNVQVDTTSRTEKPIINLDGVNNNIWDTPAVSTARPYTPRTTTTTVTPDIVTSSGSGPHRTVPVNRPASFFAQPGILAAVVGGAVVGLLCAILLVMFIVYRMRKKDEGSYCLDEPKRAHNANSYSKTPNREFYA